MLRDSSLVVYSRSLQRDCPPGLLRQFSPDRGFPSSPESGDARRFLAYAPLGEKTKAAFTYVKLEARALSLLTQGEVALLAVRPASNAPTRWLEKRLSPARVDRATGVDDAVVYRRWGGRRSSKMRPAGAMRSRKRKVEEGYVVT